MAKKTAIGGDQFTLMGGPHSGLKLRLGIRLPNDENVELPDEVRFPDGSTYDRGDGSNGAVEYLHRSGT